MTCSNHLPPPRPPEPRLLLPGNTIPPRALQALGGLLDRVRPLHLELHLPQVLSQPGRPAHLLLELVDVPGTQRPREPRGEGQDLQKSGTRLALCVPQPEGRPVAEVGQLVQREVENSTQQRSTKEERKGGPYCQTRVFNVT